MLEVFKQFDTYSLKARAFPALIAGLPALAFIFIIVPWDRLGLPQAIAVSMGAILLYAFSDMARQRGKIVQAKLEIGETPDQWLRGNTDIPEISKDRFRAYISSKLKQEAPSAEDEKYNRQQANDFYRSAGTWLRDNTRDTSLFSLLFAENVTYGFRRNLLGLKPISLFFNLVVFLTCSLIIYLKPPYFSAQEQIVEKLIITMAAAFLHSAYMVFAVNKDSVRDASKAYGRQLILSCDTLMRMQTDNSKQGNKDGND
ncbi:hypothetical protein [Falsirhodobacter sp. 20TX0035]|uniref:hypothetical protein n=1 Tax=Falsirhodobacter sp. 20TX0035 TaxID=3022019 RepID=UPI00232DE07A|nr:hypothetical protein [Falsirhodobacter sp. 20TX0035]MDB6454201.1 hypothetical protein [Falsirhodobacter sp. 20TX0035]